MKNLIIFGASSAIAEHFARLFAESGGSIFLVGRKLDQLDAIAADLAIRRQRPEQKFVSFQADLGVLDQHEEIFNEAEAAIGSIDSILIAHGILPDQEGCQEDFQKTLHALNINCTSAISILHIAAQRLGKQPGAVIAAISSVAGDRGRQSNYVYGAAKGMLSLYLQGLRNRLSRENVRVVTIKPGFVATPMTAELDQSGPLWSQPETVAAGILKAMRKGQDVVYLPNYWRYIMLIIKLIPERLFKRLSL